MYECYGSGEFRFSVALLACKFRYFVGDLLEASCLRIEERILDELQEKIGQSLPQSLKRLLRPAPVQHVGLPVDQVYDLSGEVAVPFLDCPLGVQ